MKIWVLNPPFLARFSRSQRSPAVTKSGTIYFPLWQAYAVGVLEQVGYEVTFTDAPARGRSLDEVMGLASTLRPALIVMDTSTPSIMNDLDVAARLRQILPETFIVLVGTHVSALAEETLGLGPAVDAVARHEYDYTIRDLAALLAGRAGARPAPEELAAVAGLSFRRDGVVVNNPDRPYIENLDELPWVSRVYKKHLQIGDYFNQNTPYPMVTLVTSRGCPFRCSFCVYPQTFTGRRYRFRSIPDVIAEMEYAVKEFPDARSIFFEDDTLTANKARCQEFVEALMKSPVRIPWTANSRVELDLESLKKMKAAGCRELCVGFESGDATVLTTMRKGTSVERMFQFMNDARAAGVLVHGCFMLGFPGEDLESVNRTMDLAIRLHPDTVQFYPVMVYPGTEAYDEYKKKGWLTAKDYRDWLTPEGLHNCVVRNEYFTSADLVRLCDQARRKFYLRPGYLAYKTAQLLAHPSEIGRTAKAARVFLKHLVLGSRV